MGNQIKIPSPLRRFTDNQAKLNLSGETVNDVLGELFSLYPEIKEHLFDENNQLRNFVNIFVGQENIRQKDGLETKLEDGTDLRVVPSIAGGAGDFTPQELSRYGRHITLPEVGLEGQKKLKEAKVLLVGAGGLGCPIALYLAAAGVGTLGIVDFDVVDESNLQRQILYSVDQIGKSKAESAKERLAQLNPHVKVNLYKEALTSKNALSIIKNYDLVLDGTDNFPTRYLVNDACVLLGKTNVYGSIFRFDGQVSVFNYEDGPCYRCLYPSPPPPGLVPSCAEGGVLGVLPGIIGTLQANEAIKIILGKGEPLKGRFLLFDALSMEFNEMKAKRDPECAICGDHPSQKELIDYQQFCGITQKEKPYDEISVWDLKKRLEEKKDFQFIDVRESFEREIATIEGTIHIPLNTFSEKIKDLDPTTEIVIHCKMGGALREGLRRVNKRKFQKR